MCVCEHLLCVKKEQQQEQTDCEPVISNGLPWSSLSRPLKCGLSCSQLLVIIVTVVYDDNGLQSSFSHILHCYGLEVLLKLLKLFVNLLFHHWSPRSAHNVVTLNYLLQILQSRFEYVSEVGVFQ